MKFFLSKDPVDDWILIDILQQTKNLYFPDELAELPDDILILDVGAHHGYFSVEMLQRFPRAFLIAVELRARPQVQPLCFVLA